MGEPQAQESERGDWCVLCGMSPMPVREELPDGCAAHPGCVDDPVFADLLPMHAAEEALDG